MIESSDETIAPRRTGNRPLSLEYLRECFELDPTCGSGLRWKTRPDSHFAHCKSTKGATLSRQKAGQPAGNYKRISVKNGSKQKLGAYWIVNTGTFRLTAHRAVWALHHGEDPGALSLDHIDGNTRNNRIENLRLATQGQNIANSGARCTKTSSRHKGVYFRKNRNRWFAAIVTNYVSRYLGSYGTEQEAACAYQAAAETAQGEFAFHKSRPQVISRCA